MDSVNTLWKVRPAKPEDIPVIQAIAREAWPVAYRDIIPPVFLEHELNRVFSDNALKAIIDEGERFFLGSAGDTIVGFASWRLDTSRKEGKLEKLYLRPNLKGQGHGKGLLTHIANEALRDGCHTLLLNVNRSNPAIQFYERLGFEIVAEEDIPVGPGFIRNDYIMRRSLP